MGHIIGETFFYIYDGCNACGSIGYFGFTLIKEEMSTTLSESVLFVACLPACAV